MSHILPFSSQARSLISKKEMSIKEVIFLLDITNHVYWRANADDICPYDPQDDVEKKEGWFRCTAKDFKKMKIWTRRDQDKYLTSLKSKGWIASKRRGLPAKRYIRILKRFGDI